MTDMLLADYVCLFCEESIPAGSRCYYDESRDEAIHTWCRSDDDPREPEKTESVRNLEFGGRLYP